MQNTAKLPTVFASNGALIRKPLPIIDASGVTVAFQEEELLSRLEKARYNATAKAIIMIELLSIIKKTTDVVETEASHHKSDAMALLNSQRCVLVLGYLPPYLVCPNVGV